MSPTGQHGHPLLLYQYMLGPGCPPHLRPSVDPWPQTLPKQCSGGRERTCRVTRPHFPPLEENSESPNLSCEGTKLVPASQVFPGPGDPHALAQTTLGTPKVGWGIGRSVAHPLLPTQLPSGLLEAQATRPRLLWHCPHGRTVAVWASGRDALSSRSPCTNTRWGWC